MSRAILALVAFVIAACGNAGGSFERPQGNSALTIYGTTHIAAFQPLIDDFQRLHADVSVRYEELEAGPLNERYLRETAAGQAHADLLISSAMDLQVKLVNDGYAAAHVSENGAKLPSWARWRDEAFGITFEPVVFVFNRDLMSGRRIPKSRSELLEELRRDPDFWRARIGTYDISKSSVGYLLASQDARQNSDLGSLMQAVGAAKPKVVVSTAAVLRSLERGDLVLGYNLLGSYARRSVEQGKPLTIVYPQDYTLAVSRTVILPSNAPNAQGAHVFLEYLLSLRGQRILSTRSWLNAVRPEIEGPYSQLGIAETQLGPLRPIALNPGLLVYLDQQKRRRLLESWQRTLEP